MIVVILVSGLLPLGLGGVFFKTVVEGALSVAPPLEDVLEKSSAHLKGTGADPALIAEMHQARLNLVQADVARRALVRQLPTYFATAAAVLIALLIAVGWSMGRAFARQIDGLSAGMIRFAEGDLEHQIPEPRGGSRRDNELHFAIRQFNVMGRELVAQRSRLRVTEQLAAWQDVARAMAHDLKNPLTAMRMALERLKRGGRVEPAASESLDLLAQELEVLLRMVQNFSAFAKLPEPRPQPLDLVPLLEEVCALYSEQSSGIPVDLRVGTRPMIEADPDQLRRVFENLIKNALEASQPGDGPVQVEVEADGQGVRVVVRDHGVGLSTPLEGVALTRTLRTTKPGGSGLGLPTAHKIVHDHGGRLRVEPRLPCGAAAVVNLPMTFPRIVRESQAA